MKRNVSKKIPERRPSAEQMYWERRSLHRKLTIQSGSIISSAILHIGASKITPLRSDLTGLLGEDANKAIAPPIDWPSSKKMPFLRNYKIKKKNACLISIALLLVQCRIIVETFKFAYKIGRYQLFWVWKSD